jgi:hypothetical protein
MLAVKEIRVESTLAFGHDAPPLSHTLGHPSPDNENRQGGEHLQSVNRQQLIQFCRAFLPFSGFLS